ncbi:MAG: YdcF family protein, partial [Treponemataceae bacterium]
MANILETMGVPRSALILESESRNTFENAQYSKKALEAAGAKRIVLVTSSWHMRRSAAIFKKAGIDFTPYAVDTLMEYFGVPGDYLPDAGALDNSTRIIREQIGYAVYRVLGRL